MTIERHPITDRASWLALRHQDVTASVCGALLGVHEYQTPYELWALKSGLVEESVEETGAMRRGKLLEPVALQVIREERPTWGVSPNKFYLRDPEKRIGGTPDLFASCPERGLGNIQVKTVEPMIFRQKWRDPETGGVELPLWIAVQAMVEARLAGAAWACVAAMVVGHGIQLELIEVPIHEGVLARLDEAVVEFWRSVEEKRPPSPDFARDGGTIERLLGHETGEEIDLSSDNLLPAILDEKERLAAERGAAEKRLKEIKAEILFKLGDASAARCADGRVITAKTVHRKAYEAKAASYRDVRVKGAAA